MFLVSLIQTEALSGGLVEQFFENTYPADADGVLDQLPAFDEEVHRYYDLRQADRPVDAFSDQVATISRQDVSHQTLLDKAAAQGFRLDQ